MVFAELGIAIENLVGDLITFAMAFETVSKQNVTADKLVVCYCALSVASDGSMSKTCHFCHALSYFCFSLTRFVL